MADVTRKFLNLEQLTNYDGKIKAYIAEKDLAVQTAAATDAESKANAVQAKLNEEVARAKAAEQVAQAAADGAQADVDALAGKVGTVPDGSTVMGIITNIQENAYDDTGVKADIAKNAEDITALQGKDVELVAEDERLAGLITDEATTARAAEKANADAIKALEQTHATDKAALEAKDAEIEGKVTVLVGDDTGKSARTIANEELAKQLIPEGAKESLDTLSEIAAWIQAHPDNAAAMNKAIEDLEALVGTIPEGVTATTIVGYIAEVKAVLEKAVADETAAREEADSGLDTRVKAIETQLGVGEGSVSDQISDAKAEAVSEAAADATTKANAAETNAKAYTDTEVGKDRARLDALEADTHTHANKAELDKIATGDKAKWDAAADKAHEHANKTILDGITAEKVATWDAAESNAKAHATSLNTAMDARVKAVEAKATDNATAITNLTNTHNTDKATLQAGIDANAAAIAELVEITAEEINNLFV